MNKQLVNLIGALASAAIILLGVVVFALPLFSTAGATSAAADDVAAQNRTQQTVLDALTAQAADMSALEAEVEELRAEIPEAPHLDDVLLLAVQAAQTGGGVVTSLVPAEAEEFAVRMTAMGPDGEPVQPVAGEASTAAESGADDGGSGGETAAPAPDTALPPADAPQQIAVTVVIDTADVAAATRILDELRSGPRLVAVTQAAVTTKTEGGATLTATLLAFYRP